MCLESPAGFLTPHSQLLTTWNSSKLCELHRGKHRPRSILFSNRPNRALFMVDRSQWTIGVDRFPVLLFTGAVLGVLQPCLVFLSPQVHRLATGAV